MKSLLKKPSSQKRLQFFEAVPFASLAVAHAFCHRLPHPQQFLLVAVCDAASQQVLLGQLKIGGQRVCEMCVRARGKRERARGKKEAAAAPQHQQQQRWKRQ